MSTPNVLLASASPRRAALLRQIGVTFEVQAADVDETPQPGEAAETLAQRLAAAKADAVAHRHPGAVVVGSDTVVALGDENFGKPDNRDDAAHMLSRLSGRRHRVCSGVAVVRAAERASRVCTSHVTMADIDEQAMDAYWATGEPRGKAGGYAIQGRGAVFVAHLSDPPLASCCAAWVLPDHGLVPVLAQGSGTPGLKCASLSEDTVRGGGFSQQDGR